MQPDLMDVQATTSSTRQPDRPSVWITGEACDDVADLAAEPSIARVVIQGRKGIQPRNMLAVPAPLPGDRRERDALRDCSGN